MPNYKVNDRYFDISDDKVDLFEADFPEAQLSYQLSDGRKFNISASQRKDFLMDFPDATEVGWGKKQEEPLKAKPMWDGGSYKENVAKMSDGLYYPSPLNEGGRAGYEPISTEERSKQEYEMLTQKLGRFNETYGEFMDRYEAFENVAKKQTNEGGFALDTEERRYLDANSGDYRLRKQERDEINDRIKNNSYFNQMRMAEADAASEAADGIAQLVAQERADNRKLDLEYNLWNMQHMTPYTTGPSIKRALSPEALEYGNAQADLQAAERLYRKTSEIYAAPVNNGEQVLKAFGKGAAERANDLDFWTMGLSAIEDDLNTRQAFKKIQDKFGSVKQLEFMTDKELDELLTPSEQILISAYLDNLQAQATRMDNTSGGYKAGQGAADSAMFMAQFLLTGGIGEAATTGTQVHKNVVNWLGRKIGSMNNGIAKSVARGTAKLGVGTAESIGKALVMTPLMPHTHANIADKMMSFDDKGELMDVTDAILLGASDALIETWSESTGDFVNKVLGVPGKLAKGMTKKYIKNVPFDAWGHAMNAPMMKILRKGGFNGFLGEMGEEFIGNAVRSFTIDPNAFRDFAKMENLLVTAGSFAPMTIFGLGTSSAQYGWQKRKLANAQAAFEGILREASYTEDQIKFAVDELLGSTDAHLTPERLVQNFTPLLQELAYNDKFSGNRTMALDAAVKFMWEIARYRAYDGVYHKLEQDQARDMQAEILEGTGKEFWTTRLSSQAGSDGTAYETDEVRAVEFSDGRVAYVLGNDGTGNIVVYNDGKTGFLSEDQLNEGKANGSIVSDATMGLNDYLTQQVARVRMNAEEMRMFEERNDRTAQVRAQFPLGSTVQMNTTEAPIEGIVLQHNADGVVVETPAGISQLTWEELGHTIGIEVNPQTDAQMEEEAINNLEIADLQRRRERERRRAQKNETAEAALAEAQAVDEAANEGLEKPIPMKADGTVDQTAFWNESPARWAQWKTEQRQDGGAYASTYIQNAIGILEGQIAENEAAFLAEADFDAKDALEQKIAQQKQRLAELYDLSNQYAPAQMPVQEEAQAGQAESAAPVVMAERQKYELDAEYQRRLSLARALAEKEMILKEYFEAISQGSMEAVVMNKQNYKKVMKDLGCNEDSIDAVTEAIKFAEEEHKAVDALHINDKIFVIAEYNTSVEQGRISYVHERQHNITKKRPELIQRILSLDLGRETMEKIVKTFSGSQFYEKKSDEVLADEILSFAMEIAYTYDDFSLTLSRLGLPIELINLINEINDEQRNDFTLANARRNANALDSGQRDSGQNVGDQGEVSGGILGQEGVRPSEDSERGVEAGESGEGGTTGGAEASEEGLQVPVAEVISDGEAENNAAAAQGEGDGLHDDGTAGSGQAEDAGDTEQVSGGSLGLQGAGPYDGGAQGNNGSAGTGVGPDDVAEQGTIMDMANQDDSAIRFSIRTENYLEEQIRAYANSAEGKKAGWTEEKIESIIKETRDLINAIHNSNTGNEFYDDFAVKDPTIRLDWRDGVDKPIVTWTRANIEYKYDMSADLLCINNEGLEAVLSSDKMVALMEMFIPEKKAKKGEPVIKFTADDYLELYNTLKDLGFVVPCKGCFDAAGRFKMLPSVAQKFAAEVNAVIAERNKDPKKFDEKLKAQSGEKTASGLPATSSTKSAAIAVGVAGDNLTEPIKWTQLMSADGQTKMLSDWGGIFRAWQRTGAGRPKDKLLPEPYYGDIVSSHTTIIGAYGESTPSFRDILVNTGTGLRRNSHSEFRPVLAVDEIQFMRDAFIRNLTVFKYMKELDDVRLFGKMGVKYNMSFFPEFVPGTKAAGLDLEGNYIASEESVGSREFPYFDERGVKHYDGMRGFEEAQKHINKDVSLSSVILSIPHLLKALTDVPTPSDAKGIWGSLIPFHSSGATTSSLAAQGLGLARANGVGHGFEEAMYDYGRGVTNFEAVQNDRFGKGWEIISGKKAGTKVEEGHKVEFANGTHYYNRDLGVHLFASGYILDSELPEGALMENGDLNIDAEQKKSLMHKFKVDYNDKVRELGTPYAYKEAADFYLSELPKIGLVPRFDFTVEESVFLQMCADANVDPRHPKLGWKGEGNGWSPIDSEAYYSLFCDFGMTDPATGEWSPHNPVGVVNENGKREFRLPEDTVEIVREGLERFSEVRRAESGKIDEAIKAFAERSVKKGRISKKNAEKVVGKISTSSKKSEGPIDLIDEARKANASDIAFRFVGEKAAQRTDAMVGSAQMISALHTAQQMERQLNPKWSQKKNAEALRIKMATGWEKGVDGLWRYETPDFTYKGKPDGRKEFMLPELIEDDSLFIQYPELKDARVVFADLGDNVSGKTSIDRGSILIEIHERLYRAVNPAWTEAMERFRNEKPEAAKRIGSGNALLEDTYDLNDYVGNLKQYTDQFGGRETMAHEIQHVIQEIEGFALGGGAETFDTHDPQAAQLYGRFKDEVDEVNRLVEESQKIQQKIGLARFVRNTSMEQSLQAQAQQIANEYAIHYVNYQDLERILAGFGILGEDGYERLAGEVESENVVRRLDMTPEERMQSLIADTQKMDHASQIILRNNLMVDFTEDMLSFRITPRTDEQREKLFEDAKAKYGTTKNFNAAGYMLPDGSLLDFSEANDGGDPNSRSLDHRDIEGIIMDNGVEYDSRWMYIADFMNEGAIRLLPESAGINMIKAPTEEQRKKIFDFIYKYNGEVILEINDERLNSVVYMEYDRRTSPARIFRDIDGYFNDGIVPQQDVRFRVSNENQAIFVSNAAKAVEGIKQEKATPEQWLKMIEKNGGLKAGEDKWMGLSDWLKASDKKTLTKAEVLDFIKENMIIIEETHYEYFSQDEIDEASEVNMRAKYGEEFMKKFFGDAFIVEDDMYRGWRLAIFNEETAVQLYNEANGTSMAEPGEYGLETEDYDIIVKWGTKIVRDAETIDGVRPINETRQTYQSKGLTGRHEIALTVPTIESWNEDDAVHFGEAGEGRAVAWIRFGETIAEVRTEAEMEAWKELDEFIKELYAKYGDSDAWTLEESKKYSDILDKTKAAKERKKVLVIDEIQSKRHQDAREMGGYRVPNVDKWLADHGIEVKETGEFYEFYHSDGEMDKRFSKGLLHYNIEEAKKLYVSGYNRSSVPDAPFEKNWHELAMKRMLRYAAENGYDAVAWTKGDQQNKRYNLSKVVDHIQLGMDFTKQRESSFRMYLKNGNEHHVGVDRETGLVTFYNENTKAIGKPLSELLGKELAEKVLGGRDYQILTEVDFELSEGMKGFYDKILPAFMNKYGKQWGVKVSNMYLNRVEEGIVMHSIPVTEEMKASVMEGQVMFRTTEITPEVRAEMDVIAATAIVNGNYMKAPNGADTNLTAEQWAMVRTKNFKEWFGDWENDPENASKVVDENGEPMVVYHGSGMTFTVFDKQKSDKNNELGAGFYFTDNPDVADLYTRSGFSDNEERYVRRAREIFNQKGSERGLANEYESVEYFDFAEDHLENYEFLDESVETDYEEAFEQAYDEMFSQKNVMPVFLNIRKPYMVEDVSPYNAKELARQQDVDGFIDNEFSSRHEFLRKHTANKHFAQYVVFDPNQIKSATDNTGEYSEGEDDIRFSIRTKPAPEKTGIGYKVFYLKDGKLYPPMVANQGGVDTPVGVWLDAEEGTRAGESKTGRPKVKQGGKGTQGGSGTLAYRPGWHLGEIPYAIQFNRKDENGDRTLFPADFVWAEVEYANDVDYQDEAMSYGMNANGKFQHSLAGLPKLPTDGSYRYRTNPNPETDPWIITGAMKVNRILTPSEVDQMVIDAGREPQRRQEDAVTDEQIEALNKELGLVENKVSFRVNENPTEAQKEAGNYKMGHLNLDGYRITIENPKGSVRRGTDSKGNAWENTLNNDYGYIRGTEGVDGDHIDVYLSDNPSEGNVFVIDQVNPETREFDEHKVMYGFNSAEEAREAYLANFSEGWNGLGTITEVSKDEFKKWIQSSHRKTKPFSEYKSVNAISSQSEGMEDEVMLRVTGTPTDEVVANGLDLTPAQIAELAGNIFAALPESARAEVTASLNGDILGLQDAIMQIPARLAMKENWDEEDRATADILASEVTKMAGDMTRPFSAPEALWVLYNELNKSDDLISQASRVIVQRNLGFDKQTQDTIGGAKDGVRFRMVGDAAANATASMYNRGAANVWTRLKEVFVDMYASAEELVKAIEKRSGKKAQGFENVLMALNQQSSKGLAAMESYEQKFLKPMFDEILSIMRKTGFKYSDIVRYVILKHGLERNEKLAQRDAKAHYQEIYDDIIAKIKGMNPAQKRTYLTNAQLRDADAKAELASLQGVDTSALTSEQLSDHKKSLAKAKKEATEAAEHLVRAQKIASMTEQDALDELNKIFKKIEKGTDSVYKEMRKNDYSGISSMFYDTLGVDRKNFATEEEYQSALMQAKADKYDKLGDIEGAAQMEVTLFENKVNTDNLWKNINNATKETLRQQYDANMISKDQYQNLRDMFEYYVPLRGFADNTAEDMYTYYRRPNSTGYTKPILGAEGRKTEAESPFGWIAAMAGSAIASNVKNEAKLALYYFVANRPDNGVATLSRTWFVHTPGDVDTNGKKVFRPTYPPFAEDLSTAEGKAQYEVWQANMKELQKQGLAYESGQRLNLGNAVVNISDANKPEHIVNVKIGGKDYTIVINGNPRAAQAINGDLNIETSDTYNNVLLGPWLRWLSSVNTSYNPEFWATNMMRDIAFTVMAVNIKGDAAYRRKFKNNYLKAFKVVSMVAKNENGTLGDSYVERMYKDFVKYGGVTGYTQIKDSETWEKDIEKYLKNQDADTAKAIQAVKDGLHAMHRFGESLEQVSRFAAFLTARETGKSINEAINDAKEITVNFNRKGSGKRITLKEAKLLTKNNGQRLNDVEAAIVSGISFLAPIARSTIMFFNASVQALNAWYKLWKANKWRSLDWVVGYAVVGAMNALIHALVDDDDDYLDIPQYERRSSLMLGGNGVYFKWALPQEMSAFYALGELSVETIIGRNPHQSAAAEAVKVIGDMLPVNLAKVIMDKGGWVEAIPSQIKPGFELLRNEDYKGDVIFNDQKWLSKGERERTPNWESAYKGTGRPYIEISKLLNNLTDSKDLDEAGWINIHPESLEHVVESMTGGVGRSVSKLFNFISAAISPEEDVTVRQTPFLNRFLTINDERYRNVHVNDVYEYYEAEAEHALVLEKKYKKTKDQDALNELKERDEYQWARIYMKHKKPLEQIKEKIKVAEGTAERKELMKQQDELKRQMIKEISQLP